MSAHSSRLPVAFGALAWLALSLNANAELPLAIAKLDRTTPVDFDTEVLPVLKRNCLACHHKGVTEGGLALESLTSILKGGDSGPAVIAKDAKSSLLLKRATGEEDPWMPPPDNEVGARPLTAEELAIWQLWIEQGAAGNHGNVSKSITWQPLPESIRTTYALDVSPDGQRLAFARGNRVTVVDLSNHAEVGSLIDPSLNGGEIADLDVVQSLAFSPDGHRIATGGFRTVRLWKRRHQSLDETNLPWIKPAQAMSLHFDGSAVAIVNAIGDIEIWDLVTNVRRATIKGQSEPIVGLAWMGSTQRIVVANDAGRINVYDSVNGNEIASLDLESSFARLNVSSDGVHIAVIDQARAVQLWELVEGSESTPAAIQLVQQSVGGIVDATAIALFSKPKLVIAIAGESKAVVLVDAVSNQVIRTFDVGSIADALTVSSDETRLVTGSRDAALQIWNIADGKRITKAIGNEDDTLRIAKASGDSARQTKRLAKLATKTAELQELLKKEDEALVAIVTARDEAVATQNASETKLGEAVKLVATTQMVIEKANADLAAAEKIIVEAKAIVEAATKDLETQQADVTKAEMEKATSDAELAKQQKVVEAATAVQLRASTAIPQHQKVVDAETRRLTRLEAELSHTQSGVVSAGREVVDVAFNADATRIASIHRDGSSTVYRANDGQPVTTFLPNSRQFSAAAAKRAGNEVAFCGDKLCRLGRSGMIECRPLKEQWTLDRTIGAIDDAQPIADRVTSLDFRPDGLTIAVGTGEPSRSGIVKIFDVENGELIRDLGELHSDTVLGLEFSPDGQTLASSSADKTICLVDLASGAVQRRLEGHTHHVMSVAWQDDGQVLASSGADQAVRIWNTETGETLRIVQGFAKETTAVKFVQATDQLAAACGSGEIRLLNATNGATIRIVNAGNDFQYAIAVTPNGKQLIAGGERGVIRIWNVTDGVVVTELQ